MALPVAHVVQALRAAARELAGSALQFDDQEAPAGPFKQARDFVLANVDKPDVQTVLKFVQEKILDANDRIRTTEIARAVGLPLAKVRKIMLGLNRLKYNDAILMYQDISILRHVMKKVGPSDYRWQADEG